MEFPVWKAKLLHSETRNSFWVRGKFNDQQGEVEPLVARTFAQSRAAVGRKKNALAA
jgi:hypothetical protein